MSQREGKPRSSLSEFLLRLVSCLTCGEGHNEWQSVWDESEKQPPPEGIPIFKPMRRSGFQDVDLRTHGQLDCALLPGLG